MCSALSASLRKKKVDESIQNGFRWLLRMISRMWDELDERVKTDVKHKMENDRREKAERAKRVQHSRELRCSKNCNRFVALAFNCDFSQFLSVKYAVW